MPGKTTFEEKELFLNIIVDKVRNLSDQIDQQINIIVGISSAIFVYSMTQFINNHALVHLSLTLFMGITVLCGIVAIHPFRWMRRRSGVESIMYNRRVVRYPSHVEFRQDLMKILDDSDKIVNEYSLEIYNLFKSYYRPKRDLYITTRNIFSLGIIVSLLLAVGGIFLW